MSTVSALKERVRTFKFAGREALFITKIYELWDSSLSFCAYFNRAWFSFQFVCGGGG